MLLELEELAVGADELGDDGIGDELLEDERLLEV